MGHLKEKKQYPIDPEESAIGRFSEHIAVDRMGSYTGIVESPWEKPVQDADDL